MRALFRIVLLVVVVGYAAWLVSLNTAPVDVNLGFSEFPNVAAWLVILGSLLLGAVAAGLALSIPIIRYRVRQRRARKRIAELEQELHGLRTLPLGSDEDKGEARASEV